MTLEELPVQSYFQHEDFNWEDVTDMPGADEDYLSDFVEMSINVVDGHFRNAVNPLALAG